MAAVRIYGGKRAEAYLTRLQGAVSAVGTTVVQVGVPRLAYAWGIHFGRHRYSNRLARAAGGAFFLTDALKGKRREIARGVAQALPQGPQATERAMLRLGFDVQRDAQRIISERVYARPLNRGQRTRTGNLRRYIGTYLNGRRVGV